MNKSKAQCLKSQFNESNVNLKKMSLIVPMVFILSIIILTASMAFADEHFRERRHSKNDENRQEHKEDEIEQHENILSSLYKREDKGNESTGEAATWLFVVANITVLISLLSKGIVRFMPLEITVTEKIKSFNKFQKKYLMFFHYLLNPIALIIAFVHFGLSCCVTTFLPELSLALMAAIGIAGILLKLKVSPKSIRKAVYWFHTNPMPIGFALSILVVGHTIVD
ncbi:MAG: hypothetical protein HQK72_01445 [Desulfamplus sp.]|nr:hypothetical protein [Desulfamplus sp.]